MQSIAALLTSLQTAKLLGISLRTLWTLTKNKKIKATIIPPRTVRYAPADIQDFIDRCRGGGEGK